MNSIFYRYIRPMRFNEQRVDLQVVPHGGVCLRFERHVGDLSGALWFTYARCRNDELFSRNVARRIADERAMRAIGTGALQGHITPVKDTVELCNLVIEYCREVVLPETEQTIVVCRYLKHELTELGRTLEQILVHNAIERQKLETWKASINAAHHSQRYEIQGR